MARALLGYVGNSDPSMALEIARLRRRVADLEAQLAELRERSRVEMDLELHEIAQSAQPALT